MKQTYFLAALLACFTLFTSPGFGAKQRKFIIKNHAVVDAYCAYAYVVTTENLEYHIEGWVRVPSGSAVTIEYASKYQDLYICLILANGNVWAAPTRTLRFNVAKALTEDSFKVIYGITEGTIDHIHQYTSVYEKDLETQIFYDMLPKEIGKTVSITIPGIANIMEEHISPPQPGDTSEPAAEFDGVYDTREFVRQGKDYALLFATNTYQDPHWKYLETPISDAEAVAVELFLKYGFAVDLRRNVTIRDISEALAEYAEKSYQPGDQLLVYFTGHGVFHEALKAGYIAGTDSVFPDTPGYQHSYLSHSELKSNLDKLGCERVLLVLDVSYGGTFDDTIALRTDRPTRGDTLTTEDATVNGSQPQLDMEKTLKTKTRWYLSAVGKEKVVGQEKIQNDPSEYSPFAASFLPLLRNGEGTDGVLTIPEIEHQLPLKLRAELDKAEAAWREKYPMWDVKIQQTPASGPFGSGTASNKAFVFIKSQDF